MEHPLRVEEFAPSRRLVRSRSNDADARAVYSAAARRRRCRRCRTLPASDVLFLKPSDAHYADYLPAANKRTQLSPALRAVCKTEHAVAVMVDWVRSNNLSFAVRCGGHSYEGFSQSTDVVIDLRGLDTIAVDKTAGTRHGRLRRVALPDLSGARRAGPGVAGRQLSDGRHLRPPHSAAATGCWRARTG